jgi:Autographiviridae endonuclease VII
MAKGDICKVEGCEKIITQKRTTLCSMHKDRWERYKSYNLPPKEELPIEILKKCKKHGYLSENLISKINHKGRISLRCKQCANEMTRKLRLKQTLKQKQRRRETDNAHYNRTKARHWENNKARDFGINGNAYRKILKIQNNVCAICKNLETAADKKTNCIRRMAIDHDHKTGAIRGLLCSNCNNGLGRFKDSKTYLKSAIEYLNSPSISMGYI